MEDRDGHVIGADPGRAGVDEQMRYVKKAKLQKASAKVAGNPAQSISLEKQGAQGTESLPETLAEKANDNLKSPTTVEDTLKKEEVDTSRKSIEEHQKDTNEALRHAFGREEDTEVSDTSRKTIEEYNKDTEKALQGAFGREEETAGEKEEKISAEKLWNEDRIQNGFGVVGEKAPEVIGENDLLVGSLGDLRKWVDVLRGEATEARDLYFQVKHKEESGWKKVKKYLPFLKTPPPSGDIEKRKGVWNEKLTEYKNAMIELAKREAVASGMKGKEIGTIMAETIRELDFRGSVENYNAWKDASWGDRKDSWALRAMGRAKDWGEQYRKLDWKKKMIISGTAIGIGVAGVATGSIAAIGMGAAGGTLLRLLGSYGAGRAVYELLEGYGNKRLVQKKEEEMLDIQKKEDFDFLEERMQEYATKTQENFERRVRGNRNRVIAGIGVGALLFVGGIVLSWANVAKAAEHIAGGEKVNEAVQKIIDAKGVGLSGNATEGIESAGRAAGSAAKEAVKISAGSGHTTEEMLRAAKQLTTEGQLRGTPLPGAVETGAQTPGVEGLTSNMVGSGMIDHGQAAEVAGKIGKNLAETATVHKGSSFEGVLIEKLMGSGVPKEEAGRLAHRAMLDLAKSSGKSFEIFNHAQPGAEIQYEINSDGSLHVSSVTRRAGGEIIKRLTESVDTTPPDGFERAAELTPIESINLSEVQSVAELTPTVPVNTIPLEAVSIPDVEPSLVTKVATGVGVGALAAEGATLAGVEFANMRARQNARQGEGGVSKKRVATEIVEEMGNKVEKNDNRGSVSLTEEERDDMREKARGVFDQVFSIGSFSDDRKKALRKIREGYAAFSESGLKDEVFEETKENIKKVFFGSEKTSEGFLTQKFSDVVRNDKTVGLGVKNAYVVFQGLFLRTGERLQGNIVDRSVGEVLNLITERFLTGQIPEESRDFKS